MFKKSLNLTVIVCFFFTALSPYPQAHAYTVPGLPQAGAMVNLSAAYEPVIIKGLTVHKDNPFLIDFIVDVGQDKISGEPLKKEGEKLVKYFLASLAIPDKDLWVNLSPYEKNKMVPEALGQTDMGRDLLEQDYILKQLTASLIYPERQLGKTFWDKVYSQAREKYGTTQVAVNTFNKVWIMADRAEVLEHNQTAFVVDSHLKVMLEEDYLALQKHQTITHRANRLPSDNPTHSIASNIVREIILPELEKEVNTGKNFSNLRQIFNSIILSSWYKRNLKEALLNQVYANQSRVKGINLNDPNVKEQIYEQYLKAYKKGVFNYIKEDINASNSQTIPRKYFSGGVQVWESVAAHPIVKELYNHLPLFKQSFGANTDLDLLTAGLVLVPANEAMLTNGNAEFPLNGKIPDDPGSVILKLYDSVPEAQRVDWDKVDKPRIRQINKQISDAIEKLSMMINFKGAAKLGPSKKEIIKALSGTSVFRKELFNRNTRKKFGLTQEIPPTFVFDGRIFTTYPGKIKPYRIALTLGQDFFAVTTTYSDLPGYKNFTAWTKTGLLSSHFDLERFHLAKGGDRVYRLGTDLKPNLEDKLIGNSTKPLLLEAVDLARGMGNKNPPADVFFEGGKTTFILNPDADPENATKAWVTSSILAGVLGRLYDAGPDMNSAGLMGVLQQQADRVHAVLELPQIPVTTSIANESTSFDHFKWTVTSISAFESFMVVFQNKWIRDRYNIKPRVDIIIQGFGDVGSGLVQYINNRYSKWITDGRIHIVAVSDKNGGIYDPQGLDFNELLRLRESKSGSVSKDYRSQAGKKIITFKNGTEVFYVRSNHSEAGFDHERSVVAFPAAGPGVFNSRQDIIRLKDAGVVIVVSPGNNPLKEDSGLEDDFEKNRVLFLGPEQVSAGGIITSTEEIIHKLYEGTDQLREKINAATTEYKTYIQGKVISLTMSLINFEMTEFIKQIDNKHMTTFHKIHQDIAAEIRYTKNSILSDPAPKFLDRVSREIHAVFHDYEKTGKKLTNDEKDAISLVIILYRVIEESRVQAMYDRQFAWQYLRILDTMVNQNSHNVPKVNQRMALAAVGKMGVPEARNDLLEIVSDPRFDADIQSAAAVALGKIGHRSDVPLLLAISRRTGSESLRTSSHRAARRIEMISFDSAMATDKAIRANVVEPKLKGGIDLNTSNGMQWGFKKDGNGVEMNIDSSMIARIRREGIESLSPVILRITPIISIWPLVGLQTPLKEEQLAHA